MVSGLTVNILGQDILRETDAYITTDHKAFYQDLLDTEEYEQQFEVRGAALPNYQDDPYFEKLRQDFSQVHPQS